MLNKFHEKQQGMELIILEQLVPQEHLLRKIDRSIDFSFIRRLCAPLYSANLGRPAIEPEVLFRMLFVGYLYGIRSERRLEEEINYNMAYKWFCGLSLTEKAPDATTLSVNRKRRFRDNDIPEQIFNEILRQAMEKGLVGGTILYTDSTHVKAKAKRSWARSPLTRRMTMIRPRHERSSRAKATRKAGSCTRKASRTAAQGRQAGRLSLQRAPDRGQQAQHCGECTDHSGQCQRRRTHSRDTKGY